MKKNGKIKGRVAAIVGMVVLIVLSIPIGSCISLARERGKVSVMYYGSETEWGLLEDLAWCSTEASNMITLACKYLPADDAAVSATQQARDEMNKAERPGEKAAAFSRLTAKVNALGNALANADLTDEDEEYRVQILADYNSNVDFISRNDYNTEVLHFNEILRTSPMSGLAELVGIEPLELFQ